MCQMTAHISLFLCTFMPQTVFKRITFVLTHHSYQHFAYNSTFLSLRYESHKHHYKDAVRKLFQQDYLFLTKTKIQKSVFTLKPVKLCRNVTGKQNSLSSSLSPHYFCSYLCCKLFTLDYTGFLCCTEILKHIPVINILKGTSCSGQLPYFYIPPQNFETHYSLSLQTVFFNIHTIPAKPDTDQLSSLLLDST